MKKFFTLFVLLTLALCASAQSKSFDYLKSIAQQKFNEKGYGTMQKAEDEDGFVIDYVDAQPEGELKTYSRSGNCFYMDYGTVYKDVQSGIMIDIVWAPDGKTCYLKNPISQEGSDHWMKATYEDNKIHFPLFHAVHYWPSYGYGYMLVRMNLVSDTYVLSPAKEVTYTIHEDNSISLDDTSIESILALVWTDDLSWTGFGDWESVYEPTLSETMSIPDGADLQEWYYSFEDDFGVVGRTIDCAIMGNQIYFNNILVSKHDNAIVGTIKDDKVLLYSDQCLGAFGSSMYYLVAVEVDGNKATYLPSVLLDYDREKQVVSAPEGVGFILNTGKGAENLSYWSIMKNPKFAKLFNEPATPADPKMLSYENYFNDLGYDVVNADVPAKDVDGNNLNVEKLYYILWTSVDGEEEPFTFYADTYFSFSADGYDQLTEVPYSYDSYNKDGYTDIFPGGSTLYLYEHGFDDFGIQSVYYGGDERRTSNISWLYKKPEGIQNVAADSNAIVYDLSGRRLSSKQHGINVVVGADGTVRKEIVK